MRRTLYDYIKEDGGKTNILVFAEGGAGKSTQLMYAFKRMLTDAQNGMRIIPIYIDVKSLEHNRPCPIIRYIAEKYCGKLLDTDCIEERMYEVLAGKENNEAGYTYYIMVDGLNETAHKNNIINDIKKLCIAPMCRFAVTSRIDEDDYVFDGFKRLKLQKIKGSDVPGIIERKTGMEKRIERERMSSSLIEILRTPLFLSTFCKAYDKNDALAQLYDRRAAREADILSAYISKVLNDVRKRAVVDENSMIEFSVRFFMPRLGYCMAKSAVLAMGDREFTAALYSDETEGLSERYFRGLLSSKERSKYLYVFKREIDKIQDYCQNLSLFKYNEISGTFEFSHQIWRDYFAAQHIVNLMKVAKIDELTFLPYESIRRFAGELIHKGDKCECDYEEKRDYRSDASPIEEFMQNNYEALNAEPVVIKNLIRIMRTARNDSITARYDNLDFKHVKFVKCSLSGSSFNNAKIYEKNFLVPGHSGYVYDALISESNKVISCGKDATVRVWDMERKEQEGKALKQHANYVASVAAIKGGRYVLSGSYDKTILMWDMDERKTIGKPFCGHTKAINHICVSPDEKYVVSVSNDRTVRVWEVSTQEQAGNALEGHEAAVNMACITDDGKYIISGSDDKTVRIWDFYARVQCGAAVEFGAMVKSVCVIPGRKTVAAGGSDGIIRLWNIGTKEECCEPLKGHRGAVSALAASPCGRYLASGGYDGNIKIWDTEEYVQVNDTIFGHADWVNSLRFSPNGSTLVSAGGDQAVKLWSIKAQGYRVDTLVGSVDWINALAVSPDGRYIVSGGDDAAMRIWHRDTGVLACEPLTGHEARINALAVTPDGKYAVSGSDDATVRIWDMELKKQVGKSLSGHKSWVRALTVTPDGKHIISGSWDNTMRMWDIESHKEVGKPFAGHCASVEALAVTHDGKYVISGSDDNTIRVWSLETHCQVGEAIRAHNSWIRALALTPDDKYIISGSWDNTIRIWSLEKRTEVGEPLCGHKNRIDSVAATNDGKYIISGSDDNTIRIWDLEERKPFGEPLRGHDGSVSVVSLTKDGKHIVSGGGDGKIKIWDIKQMQEVGSITQIDFNGYGVDLTCTKPQAELTGEFFEALRQNGCIVK